MLRCQWDSQNSKQEEKGHIKGLEVLRSTLIFIVLWVAASVLILCSFNFLVAVCTILLPTVKIKLMFPQVFGVH